METEKAIIRQYRTWLAETQLQLAAAIAENAALVEENEGLREAAAARQAEPAASEAGA